jgi:hypothetical protein
MIDVEILSKITLLSEGASNSIARLCAAMAASLLGLGSLRIGSQNMQDLFHWFEINGTVMAVLVTVGVAVLLVSCLECSHCPKRDKDDIFNRREL